jgi:hypothetical protein
LLDEQDDESGEVTHVDYLNWPIQPVGDRDGTRACGATYPIGEQPGPFMRPDHPPGANDAEPLAELSGEGVLASHLQRAVTAVTKEFGALVGREPRARFSDLTLDGLVVIDHARRDEHVAPEAIPECVQCLLDVP